MRFFPSPWFNAAIPRASDFLGLRISQFPPMKCWRRSEYLEAKKRAEEADLARGAGCHFWSFWCWKSEDSQVLLVESKAYTIDIHISVYNAIWKGRSWIEKNDVSHKSRLYSGSHSASHLGRFSIFFNEVDYVVDTVTESADDLICYKVHHRKCVRNLNVVVLIMFFVVLPLYVIIPNKTAWTTTHASSSMLSSWQVCRKRKWSQILKMIHPVRPSEWAYGSALLVSLDEHWLVWIEIWSRLNPVCQKISTKPWRKVLDLCFASLLIRCCSHIKVHGFS